MHVATFSKRAFSVIVSECSRYENEETGGILLGYYNNYNWEILETIFPGPNAIHRSAEFLYDNEYVDYEINSISLIYEIPLKILGIWHTHVTDSPFSLMDEKTNLQFAKLNPFGTLSLLVNKSSNKFELFFTNITGEYKKINFNIASNDIIN